MKLWIKRLLVASAFAGAMLLSSGAAFAQYVSPTPVEVAPFDTQRPEAGTEVRGQQFRRGLPVTGSDIAMLASIGGVAVVAGVATRRAARSRGR